MWNTKSCQKQLTMIFNFLPIRLCFINPPPPPHSYANIGIIEVQCDCSLHFLSERSADRRVILTPCACAVPRWRQKEDGGVLSALTEASVFGSVLNHWAAAPRVTEAGGPRQASDSTDPGETQRRAPSVRRGEARDRSAKTPQFTAKLITLPHNTLIHHNTSP